MRILLNIIVAAFAATAIVFGQITPIVEIPLVDPPVVTHAIKASARLSADSTRFRFVNAHSGPTDDVFIDSVRVLFLVDEMSASNAITVASGFHQVAIGNSGVPYGGSFFA